MGEKPTGAEEGDAARKAAEEKGKDRSEEREAGEEWSMEPPEIAASKEGGAEGSPPPDHAAGLAVSDEGAPGKKSNK